jgi:phage terminase large subunit
MPKNRLQIPTAAAFMPLLDPSRYKGAWGGRGSGKSRFFAGLMVEEHLRFQGHRSVCIREVQKSLKQSAKKLIEDTIQTYNLGEAQGFKIFREVIETPGDGLIIFQGMQDHTADSVKSLEGFDRAWVEEAQSLSDRSLPAPPIRLTSYCADHICRQAQAWSVPTGRIIRGFPTCLIRSGAIALPISPNDMAISGKANMPPC